MTKTIKQQLQEIRDLDKSIDSKIRQVERLRAQAECLKSMDFSKDRVMGGKDKDPLKVMDKAIDLEREITKEIDRLVDMKREWQEKIKILSSIHRNVIEDFYFNGKTFEVIAVNLSYTYRHVTRLHGHALQILENDGK